MKKTPVVSPAHGFSDRSPPMIPATCNPELKTY
jgi:hypothetical protein